jgi:magnesium transporter
MFRVLTIFSVIFVPLTFIAGVYGMNFEIMPELNQPFGYFTVWAVMIIIAVIMLFYFRRKGWF